MLRTTIVAAAAACTPAARHAEMANHATASLLAVFFPDSLDVEDDAHQAVYFQADAKLPDGDVTMFAYTSGAIVTGAPELVDGTLYRLRLPPHTKLGTGDTAVLAPAPRGARVGNLHPADQEWLEQLADPHIASVATVNPKAISLDGSGRPDLAFVEVCRRPSQLGGPCYGAARCAARRAGDRWTLDFCFEEPGP